LSTDRATTSKVERVEGIAPKNSMPRGGHDLPEVNIFYDEAKKNGWFVISMTNVWKRIFAFEK
jgi:hypothetical protein